MHHIKCGGTLFEGIALQELRLENYGAEVFDIFRIYSNVTNTIAKGLLSPHWRSNDASEFCSADHWIVGYLEDVMEKVKIVTEYSLVY